MRNRIREVVFLFVIFAAAGLPIFAQDATSTLSAGGSVASSSAGLGASTEADPAPRPSSWGAPEGRMFFPHNSIRGYVDFSVALPHNEPDLGRCSQSHAVIISAGGANSNCNAYARYLLGGYLEIQPFGRTVARHLFVFFVPTFSFGSNVPQFKYSASMSGIAFERAVGVGFELPKNFEIRITQHQVDWLGKYNHNVGLADLTTSGPYGLYSTIGARYYFGGYGRSRQ
ncbi:MAG TPA: hypothetical protein VHS08_05165 [Candidatus Acidoferrales bacterium]|nr:hypothetical protein [Candidatus Acidoferrales bacterium]